MSTLLEKKLSKETEISQKKDARTILFNGVNVKDEEISELSKKELNKFNTSIEADKLNKIYDKYDLLDLMRSNGETATTNSAEEKIEDEFMNILATKNVEPASLEVNQIIRPKIKGRSKVKAKINFRGKLILAGYSCIVLLFGFLAIFNSFYNDNLNKDITTINNEITANESYLGDLYNTYSNLKKFETIESWAINNGATEITDANKISLIELELREKTETTKESNWFDAICDFISNLFGG